MDLHETIGSKSVYTPTVPKNIRKRFRRLSMLLETCRKTLCTVQLKDLISFVICGAIHAKKSEVCHCHRIEVLNGLHSIKEHPRRKV